MCSKELPETEAQGATEEKNGSKDSTLRFEYSDGKKLGAIGNCWWPFFMFAAPCAAYLFVIRPSGGGIEFENAGWAVMSFLVGIIWLMFSIAKAIQIHKFNGEASTDGLRVGKATVSWDQITQLNSTGDDAKITIQCGDDLLLTIPSEIEDIAFVRSFLNKKIAERFE